MKTALGTAFGLTIYSVVQICPRAGRLILRFHGIIPRGLFSIMLASVRFLMQRKNEERIEQGAIRGDLPLEIVVHCQFAP